MAGRGGCGVLCFLSKVLLLQCAAALSLARDVSVAVPNSTSASAVDEITAATCEQLQSRIQSEQQGHLKDLSCRLLGRWQSTKRSRGCECRLLQKKATGGACPFDCASSGVPACVDGAAKELGLTGLTPGEPVAVPQQLGKGSLEAFTCTYWHFMVNLGGAPTDEEDLRARMAGRLRFVEMMKTLGAEAEPVVEQKLAALNTPAKFDFKQSLQGVSDGGPKAWARIGQNEVHMGIPR